MYKLIVENEGKIIEELKESRDMKDIYRWASRRPKIEEKILLMVIKMNKAQVCTYADVKQWYEHKTKIEWKPLSALA